MKQYPHIGSVVTYARADEKGEVHVGQGMVMAIFVGQPDRKLMVQVKEAGAAYNVDLAMIDHTPEELETYRAAVAEVQKLTDEGNAKVREIVAEFNAKVEEVYIRVLGEPVNVELPVKAGDEF